MNALLTMVSHAVKVVMICYRFELQLRRRDAGEVADMMNGRRSNLRVLRLININESMVFSDSNINPRKVSGSSLCRDMQRVSS